MYIFHVKRLLEGDMLGGVMQFIFASSLRKLLSESILAKLKSYRYNDLTGV